MPTPILELDPAFEISQSYKIHQIETTLGDGYSVEVPKGQNISEVWQVSRTGLRTAEMNTLLATLKQFSGVQNFQWRANTSEPYKVFTCDKWNTNLLAPDLWSISADFVVDNSGECVAFAQYLDSAEITNMIAGANTFLTNYTRASLPMAVTVNNFVPNSWHTVLGRAGYFPASAATSEAQAVLIRGSIWAFKATGNTAWRTRAINLANAYLSSFFNLPTPPANPNTLWLPHWLINVKEPFTSKGQLSSPDPINSGYFDLIVNFVNGVGTIPANTPNFGNLLSDVYRVYPTTAKLLWKNVYAPVIYGTPLSIQYWVSNFMLAGQNFRIFPDTAGSSGTLPIATTEPTGKIVLNTPFNGNLKVTYSAYTGSVIGIGQKFDAYPLWRELFTGEANCANDVLGWSYECFDELYKETNNSTWLTAREAIKQNSLNSSVVNNPTAYYKKSTNTDEFEFPGSQIVQSNNANGYTTSRITSGTFKDFISIVSNAAPNGSFPSIELQNFIVQTKFEDNVTVRIEASSSVVNLLEVSLSTSSDAFDLTETYTAYLKINNTTGITTRTILPGEFIKLNSKLVWYITIAENPVYTFSGSGGTVTQTFFDHTTVTEDGIDYSPVVLRYSLASGASGFAGFGLVLLGRPIVKPPYLKYKVDSGSVILRLTDGSGFKWDTTISDNNWTGKKFEWNDFTFSPVNTLSNPGSPDDQNPITNIEFNALPNSTGVISIQYAAVNAANRPERLPYPCTTYKASVVSRVKTLHTIRVGEFKPLNSVSDQLMYNPGVMPFTTNVLGGVVDAYRGIPLVGYSVAPLWAMIGDQSRLTQALQFLSDSQDAYLKQNINGTSGFFVPSFAWNFWDNAEFLDGNTQPNTWIYNSVDPSFFWCGYQTRTVYAAAHCWYMQKDNQLAKTVTMRFLAGIDSFLIKNNTIQPPTEYREFIDPTISYHEPHTASHIMIAALYANLSGGDPAITFRVLFKMFNYIRSQYISSGTMLGSFAAGQPNFTSGGIVYKEFFTFWLADIVYALSLLSLNKQFITYPPCSVSLS